MSTVLVLGLGNFSVSASVLQQDQQARDVLLLILIILVSAVSMMGLIILLRALLPQAGKHSQRFLQRSPWRSFFIGLVNYIFLGGIIIAIGSAGIEGLNLIAVLILTVLIAITVFGLCGLASLTGERIANLRDGPMSPLKQTIWGIGVLELACLLPFVGWFLLTPIVLMLAFGSAVLGWRNRKTSEFDVT